MKVAIIGAGLSGLSCAIELKNLGVTPTVFEKSDKIGDLPGYLLTSLRLFTKTIDSPMAYLKKNYNIDIKDFHTLDEIVMVSPNKTISAKGSMGYIFEKGPDKTTLENQLSLAADLSINFNTYINLNDIKKDFDHIVVATGSPIIAEELNVWITTFRAQIRIAKVLGDFKPGLLKIWLNKNYANNGYGYLTTKTKKMAELILIVSDIEHNELDDYWNTFISGENIKYDITAVNDIPHIIGYSKPVHMGNIYFTGNAAGMIDSFLGFGSIRAIESGVLAARAIAKNLDYSKLIDPLLKEVDFMYNYRKMINNLNNNDYDKLVSFIGLPVIKQMLYNNPIYKAKHGILFPKIINLFKQNSNKINLL
ncbi:MAG TPA: NAD(P)/FAD-dependent oxidoreductase [Patescibacteria group bacterium]|nr:NAD(P)/FAD-dependent oxidoreductase [Patescibacteria group bacterium]